MAFAIGVSFGPSRAETHGVCRRQASGAGWSRCRRAMVTSGGEARKVSVELVQVEKEADLAAGFAVRKNVFVDEMGISEELEYDEWDEWDDEKNVWHFFLRDASDRVAGACRAREYSEFIWKVERVAILKSFRGSGYGRDMIAGVVRLILERKPEVAIMLHSMSKEQGFYERLGFTVVGEEFSEIDIPHVEMIYRSDTAHDRRNIDGHTAIYCKDIHASIQFYSLFSYKPSMKFLTSGTKAAWMDSGWFNTGVELIEIPDYMQPGDQSPSPPVVDLLQREPSAGLNHISLDVTRLCSTLDILVGDLQRDSAQRFSRSLRILQPPKRTMMGPLVCETAFLADPNDVVIELLRKISYVSHAMAEDW